MSNKTKIKLSIVWHLEMNVGQVWPDGDAPEHPTADDVIGVMKKYHGTGDVIREWNLGVDMDVCVSGDGETTTGTLYDM